ncbi:MAG: hypothetical protein U0V64_09630 [Cyclobacteriaceae bacterium]
MVRKEQYQELEGQSRVTHVATPENATIEAFHGILDRELIQRVRFTGYYDAKARINDASQTGTTDGDDIRKSAESRPIRSGHRASGNYF